MAKVLVGKRYVSEAGAAIRSSKGVYCEKKPALDGMGWRQRECAQGLGGRRATKAQLLYDRSSPGLGWIVELAVLLAWTKRYLTSKCRDVVVLVLAVLCCACYGSSKAGRPW